MTLFEECESHFSSRDLYEVLSSSKTADSKELKKAYYKASLKFHPDRVSQNKDDATQKFQILGKVYSILSNVDTRAVYDESGEIDDESFSDDKDWNQYWRLFFKKITIDDIKNFEQEYKGSEDELNDLLQAYNDGEGSMQYILENVMCAHVDDEERYEGIINKWIKEKKVECFLNFTNGASKKQKSARKKKSVKEAEEAASMRQELGLDSSEEGLRLALMKKARLRETGSEDFLKNLEAKYAPKPKGGQKRKRDGK